MITISDVHLAGTSFADQKAVHAFGDDITDNSIDLADVEVIPEPENPHDSNAIKVLYKGTHVGHIAAVAASNITRIMARYSHGTLAADQIQAFKKNDKYGFWMKIQIGEQPGVVPNRAVHGSSTSSRKSKPSTPSKGRPTSVSSNTNNISASQRRRLSDIEEGVQLFGSVENMRKEAMRVMRETEPRF